MDNLYLNEFENFSLKFKLLEAKEDELHFHKQIYRNLKHLELLYKNGSSENKDKAFYTEVSLNNTLHSINKLEKEIEELSKK